MATQKFANFNKFFQMLSDMTTVTIQSNKIVSNKVKKIKHYLEPQEKKTNELLGQPNASPNKGLQTSGPGWLLGIVYCLGQGGREEIAGCITDLTPITQ